MRQDIQKRDATSGEGKLLIGWRIGTDGHPLYWRNGIRPDEEPTPDQRVDVKAKDIAAHTAIIAQSGSGKSFFLGRLIEEILLNTHARCLILDPNADFRNIRSLCPTLSEPPTYDRVSGVGRLRLESQTAFEKVWDPIAAESYVYCGSDFYPQGSRNKDLPAGVLQFKLRWQDISSEFLGEGLGEMQNLQLRHCHEFVQSIARLMALFAEPDRSVDPDQLLSVCEGIKDEAAIDKRFPDNRLIEQIESRVDKELEGFESKQFYQSAAAGLQRDYQSDARLSKLVAKKAIPYIKEGPVRSYYFARAREYQHREMLSSAPLAHDDARLRVIDLPSFRDKGSRLLAVNYLLTHEWRKAQVAWARALSPPTMEEGVRVEKQQMRVPTFIVVDEAHNLIPAEARSGAESVLREQFRTIVAEGRKYGLFLILVSQRPDKLDPMVVTECENRAVMKLSAGAVLETTRRALGLDDVSEDLMRRCLRYRLGRVLLVGRWAGRPQEMCAAARRTREGGGNLPDDWTTPGSDGKAASGTHKGSGTRKGG